MEDIFIQHGNREQLIVGDMNINWLENRQTSCSNVNLIFVYRLLIKKENSVLEPEKYANMSFTHLCQNKILLDLSELNILFSKLFIKMRADI